MPAQIRVVSDVLSPAHDRRADIVLSQDALSCRRERAELWPGVVLSREQPFERWWIGARYAEYLHSASGSCHQRD